MTRSILAVALVAFAALSACSSGTATREAGPLINPTPWNTGGYR